MFEGGVDLAGVGDAHCDDGRRQECVWVGPASVGEEVEFEIWVGEVDWWSCLGWDL